ncbi:MAG: hypothetical protein ACI9NQ_001723 [Paracoccaceae bacterium]|jgi:hypothetical protein
MSTLLIAIATKLQLHLIVVGSIFFGVKAKEVKIDEVEREQTLQELRFELQQLQPKEENLQKFQELRQKKD